MVIPPQVGIILQYIPIISLLIGIMLGINSGKNLAYKRHDLRLIQSRIADKAPMFKQMTAHLATIPLILAYLLAIFQVIVGKINQLVLKIAASPIRFLTSGQALGAEDLYGIIITTVLISAAYFTFKARASRTPSEPRTKVGKVILKGEVPKPPGLP